MLKIKVIVGHSQKCEEEGFSARQEYYLPDGEKCEWRDAIGRATSRGHYRWIPFRCNNLDCQSLVLVRADTIEDLLTKQLGGTGR